MTIYLREYLLQICEHAEKIEPSFKIAMISIEYAPIIEARYEHLTPPDFRLFQNANQTKYLGPLQADSIQEWALGKIGITKNRVRGNL